MTKKKIRAAIFSIILIIIVFQSPAQDESYHTFSEHTRQVFSIRYSPDGSLLASAGADSVIILYDVKTKSLRKIFRGHSKTIRSIDFSSNGKYLISGGEDHAIKLWDINKDEEIFSFQLNGQQNFQPNVNAVSFTPDDKQIIAAYSDNFVRIWKFPDEAEIDTFSRHKPGKLDACGKTISSFKKHKWAVNDLDFLKSSFTSRNFVTGASDKALIVWDTKAGAISNPLTGHAHKVNAVDYSNIGRKLASADQNGRVVIWHAPPGGFVIRKFEHVVPIHAVRFSNDGDFLAYGGADKDIIIWAIDSVKNKPSALLKPVILNGHQGAIQDLCFSPDGRFLASASRDKTVKIWKIDKLGIRFYYYDEIAKIIQNNPQTFGPKDEFETNEEYLKRQQRIYQFKDSLYATFIDKFKKMEEIRSQKEKDRIEKSRHKVTLRIDTIGKYNPEPDPGYRYFWIEMSVVNGKKGIDYKKVKGKFYINRANEEARLFKQNYKDAVVTGVAELDIDGDKYIIHSIEIRHPHKKFKKVYKNWNEPNDKFYDPDAKG